MSPRIMKSRDISHVILYCNVRSPEFEIKDLVRYGSCKPRRKSKDLACRIN